MSEQQPPAGTPEYLEPGGGWPVPPPAAQPEHGRRNRRTTWLVGGGVAAMLALGAGAWAALSFFQQGPQPAVALPATTVAYLGVDLDPSGGQKIDAFRTLNKFPAFKDKVGIHTVDDVRRKIGEAIVGSIGCHLTYDADIAPWLGDRAAVAAVDLGNPNPDQVVVVQVKDDGKAQAGLHALTACGGSSAAGYDVVHGWAVVARTQELADQVVADTKRGSLADDAAYRRWTKAVGDSGVVNLYAAPAAGDYLARQLTQLGSTLGGLGLSTGGLPGEQKGDPLQLEPGVAVSPVTPSTYPAALGVTGGGSGALEQQLRNFQGAAATIRFTGSGLELATASDPGLYQTAITSDRGGAVVSRLPDDTAAAVGVGLEPGWVRQLADRFASSIGGGSTGGRLLHDLGKASGLDVPADLETLLGSSTALSVSKDLDVEAASNSTNGQGVPVAVTVQGDPAAIEKVLTKLRAQDGSAATSWGSDSSGDLVAIGPTASYRREILAGGHLGDSSAFRSVVPDAAHAGLVAYVNVDDLEKALSQVLGADRQFISNLAPLRTLGFSAWTDHGVARSSFKVSTN